MSIFQNTVVSKHLKGQNSELISAKWNIYKEHFLNQKVQDDIRNLKEEQYQGEFLEDLFVKILGYTKPASSSETKFNLTTEYKNVKDSKKADGAIIINEVVKAVIELKGTNTTDLAKVETQAFGYKNNQPECTYVITSNFEKLRFYIDNAIEHIEFNLFTLSEKEFKLLYLCLAYENIEKDIPKKIKEESVSEEDAITKKLYKDYSLFRRELHHSLVELNPQYDALTLFKKTQKLLDRFLFLFFAEDRHLLPPNSVRLILKQWEKLKELDAYTPLFDRFKKYFGYLNTGFKGKKYDVYAYNGGLFKTDVVLDTITIDDELLYKHTLTLSEYDFNSEVDVDILGHIFENSLTEIEEIQAKLEGQEVEKSTSKRKKDGVFYTPKYITKYIVENTVGKLCEEKKKALLISDERYQKPSQQRSRKRLDNLQLYRDWLLQLTICDPACGSGAFLNQALDFLINEHRYIDELSAKYNNDTLVLSDVENSILENNLFGVDINEESVEIAKLSLWLRTAQPNRKLNDLSNNIKCGNSLIDDPEVAGEKAFKWEVEFSHIFSKGGFDVVIGNPPYVPTEYITEEDRNYLEVNYSSAFGRINLYPIFYERGLKILNKKGLLGYITPYTILKNQYYKEARKYIIENSTIIELIDFKGVLVFQDAAVDSIILLLKNEPKDNYEFKQISNIKSFENLIYSEDKFNLSEIKSNSDLSMLISVNDKLIKRICSDTIQLKNIVNFNQGIITGGNSKHLTLEHSNETEKIITGSNFNRYYLNPSNQLILYTKNLHRPRKREIFEVDEKILLRQTSSYPICTLDNQQHFTLDTVHNGLLINKKFNLKYILTLLNSKLFRFMYESSINEGGKIFAQVKIIYIDPLPIKKLTLINQQPFIIKGEQMILINNDLKKINQKFQRTLQRKFELEKLSKKLQEWYTLSFADFIKELKKKKIKLSLAEEAEWEDYFLKEQQKALEIKSKIDTTDAAIDQMMYELYGLTEEEIEIIENS